MTVALFSRSDSYDAAQLMRVDDKIPLCVLLKLLILFLKSKGFRFFSVGNKLTIN